MLMDSFDLSDAGRLSTKGRREAITFAFFYSGFVVYIGTVWLDGVMVRALKSSQRNFREFDSQPSASCSHTCNVPLSSRPSNIIRHLSDGSDAPRLGR